VIEKSAINVYFKGQHGNVNLLGQPGLYLV